MSQNIKLNDGEVAVIIGNASIIMNVNTAFDIVGKLFADAGCDCLKEKKDRSSATTLTRMITNLKLTLQNISRILSLHHPTRSQRFMK